MVEVAPPKGPPRRDDVALVDAEPEQGGKDEAERGARCDQNRERTRCVGRGPALPIVRGGKGETGEEAQAATTRWRCSPRPWIPSRIVCPALRKIGCGFLPSPTPGGVPVEMMSPGWSVKNCER